MPRSASARRYAQAVFQIALEKGELDRWLEDLTLLVDALVNEEFFGFLDAPQLSVSQKVQVIQEALGDAVSPLALNLFSLLASRSAVHLTHGITEIYQEMLDAHRGIERAEVISAVPLNDGQRQRVSDLLQTMVGKEIRLTVTTEPRILGGFVARVGDRVIDGSTRTKLNDLRRDVVQQAS